MLDGRLPVGAAVNGVVFGRCSTVRAVVEATPPNALKAATSLVHPSKTNSTLTFTEATFPSPTASSMKSANR